MACRSTTRRNQTIFISGHIDITPEQWEIHYKGPIDDAISLDCKFVLGDARGTDRMSISYLWEKKVKNVTIFHMYENARHNPGYNTNGGYTSDELRDKAMTEASDVDIAWVRPEEETKKLYGKKYRKGRISGTQKNINRRLEF